VLLDKDLQDLQFVCIKPGLMAQKTFIHGNDILIRERPWLHFQAADRAVYVRSFFPADLPDSGWIQQKILPEVSGFSKEMIRESDFFAGNNPADNSRVNKFASAGRTDL